MPTRYVQLPNGKYLEWPEGVSAADFKAKAQKLVGPATPGLEPGQSLPGVPGVAKPDLPKLDTLSPGGGWSPDDALRGAGAGIKSLVTHPIQSGAGMVQGALASGMSPMGEGYPAFASLGTGKTGQEAEKNNLAIQNEAQEGQTEAAHFIGKNPAFSAGAAAGPALLLHGAAKAAPAISSVLRTTGGGLNDALIGTPSEGLHGAEPGLTMAKRGIVGSSPASLTHSLNSEIPVVSAEHRGIVAAAPSGTKINTGPLIAPPFDEQISAGINPRTGAASPAQIGSALRTRTQLTHVPSDSGAPTPMMRDPNISPLEATDLKSNIYDRTNYDPSGKTNLSNAGLKGAAHGLKTAVESAVPESVPSGHDLHSLVQAKEILDPAARGQLGIPTSRSGLIDRAVTGVGTRTASGMYSAGDAIQSAAPLANVAAPSAAVAALMQTLRQQKGQQQ